MDRLPGRPLGDATSHRPEISRRLISRRSFALLTLMGALALLAVGFLCLEAANRAAAERARSDAFYGRLYGFEAVGPIPTSLADLGRVSQAVVIDRSDGAVEPGRVEPGRVVAASELGPESYTYFANVGFRIESILAGSLPAADASDVLVEYLVADRDEIEALKATLSTERPSAVRPPRGHSLRRLPRPRPRGPDPRRAARLRRVGPF